jgi:hypothetical protein
MHRRRTGSPPGEALESNVKGFGNASLWAPSSPGSPLSGDLRRSKTANIRYFSCKMLNSEEDLATERLNHRAASSGERHVQAAWWEGQPRRSRQGPPGHSNLPAQEERFLMARLEDLTTGTRLTGLVFAKLALTGSRLCGAQSDRFCSPSDRPETRTRISS